MCKLCTFTYLKTLTLISTIKGTAQYRIHDHEIWPITGTSFSKLPTGQSHIQEYLQFYLHSPHSATMIQLSSHFIKLCLRGKKKRMPHVQNTRPWQSLYIMLWSISFAFFLLIILSYIFKIYCDINKVFDLPYTNHQRTDG